MKLHIQPADGSKLVREIRVGEVVDLGGEGREERIPLYRPDGPTACTVIVRGDAIPAMWLEGAPRGGRRAEAPRRHQIRVYLTEAEMEELDRQRGDEERSPWIARAAGLRA